MSKSDDSWDFKVEKSKSEKDTTQKTITIPKPTKKKDNLFDEDDADLNVSDSRPQARKSRKALAKEYEREEDRPYVPSTDELYGSFFRRASAFFLDIFVTGVVSILVLSYAPQYSIELENLLAAIIGQENTIFEFFLFCSFVFVYFVFVSIPHILFGASFGKKMMNVKVFGLDRVPVGFLQSLIREIFLKPLSFVSVLGVVICFFSKKRKMMHDHILNTEVHRE